MNKLKTFISVALSIVIALGTINPFQGVPTDVEELYYGNSQSSIFLIPVLLLFILITLGDKKCREAYPMIKSQMVLLFFMGLCFALGDIFYDTMHTNFYMLAKYLFAVISFCCIFLFYYTYPEQLKLGILIYCIVVSIMVIGYFSGLLSSFTFYHQGRLILFGENPNSTSSRFGLGALLILSLIQYSNYNKFQKIILLVCYILVVFYLMLSGSRGSFGFVIIFSLLISRSFIKRHLLLSTVIISVVIIFGLSFLANYDFSLFERFKDLQYGNSRTMLMKNAMTIYGDYPVCGVGFNGYEVEKLIRGMDHHDSHCIATSILVTGGTFGFLFFIFYIFKILKSTFRRFNSLPCLLALFILIISLKTGGAITWILMWYGYAICLALGYGEETSLTYRQS